MKTYCAMCSRQITHKNKIWDKNIQAPTPITALTARQVACSECSEEFDKNGLLPGEPGYKEY